jgi:hypothetical protein
MPTPSSSSLADPLEIAGSTATPAPQRPAVLTETKLRQMYVALLECSLLADYDRGHHDDSVPTAILAGFAAALEPADKILLPQWNVAAGHLRGVPLKDLLSQAIAKKSSAADNNRSHLLLQLAAGVAWAEKLSRPRHAIVVFTDPSAPPHADDENALNFAFTRKLPLVFVSKAASLSARKKAAIPAQTFVRSGIPCMAVDGNDTVAVFRVAGESLLRARDGGGPTWIESHTGPWPQVVSQKSSDRRSAQHDSWQARPPLEQMEFYLTMKGHFFEDWTTEIRASFQARLRQAKQQAAKTSPPPSLGCDQGIFCFNDVAAQVTPSGARKR